MKKIQKAKKHFLKKRFPGITEYVASKTKSKEPVMLIYNKNLAVSPLTTHLPLKLVSKKITKKLISNQIKIINNFFLKILNSNQKLLLQD